MPSQWTNFTANYGLLISEYLSASMQLEVHWKRAKAESTSLLSCRKSSLQSDKELDAVSHKAKQQNIAQNQNKSKQQSPLRCSPGRIHQIYEL